MLEPTFALPRPRLWTPSRRRLVGCWQNADLPKLPQGAPALECPPIRRCHGRSCRSFLGGGTVGRWQYRSATQHVESCSVSVLHVHLIAALHVLAASELQNGSLKLHFEKNIAPIIPSNRSDPNYYFKVNDWRPVGPPKEDRATELLLKIHGY